MLGGDPGSGEQRLPAFLVDTVEKAAEMGTRNMKLVNIATFSRLGDRPSNRSHTPSPCSICWVQSLSHIRADLVKDGSGITKEYIGIMLVTPTPLPQIKFLMITLEPSSGRSYF